MKYVVNVDRGVEFDPLTGRVMDLRGEHGMPFVHKDCGEIIDVTDIGSAEMLVKKGFLISAPVERGVELRIEKK